LKCFGRFWGADCGVTLNSRKILGMKRMITDKCAEDVYDLSKGLQRKFWDLMHDLRPMTPAELHTRARPGWRLHALQASDFDSFSLDRNFRVLVSLRDDTVFIQRVVKHDEADKASVNRSAGSEVLSEIGGEGLRPRDVHDALLHLGIDRVSAAPFEQCETDDDVVAAIQNATIEVGKLALSLYELSVLSIPKARYQLLYDDDEFRAALATGSAEWEMYIHPSQEVIINLPVQARAAVAGSAGTGKTICAWYRCASILRDGNSIGFVCPTKTVLAVSQQAMDRIVPAGSTAYFLVPSRAAELEQLAATVDHIVIDEAQEIPWTWLTSLGSALQQNDRGATIFYDVNQLSGNIPNNDHRRYERRLADWEGMLSAFAGLRRYTLTINYRNSREIAAHWLNLLGSALPVRPSSEVPAFQAGEVVVHQIVEADVPAVLAGALRQLLAQLPASDIGVAVLFGGRQVVGLLDTLRRLKLPITNSVTGSGIALAPGEQYRGFQRRAMVIVGPPADRLARNFGTAVGAYIAMSRATTTLVVLEVSD
jgi:hypothetical protein